MVLHVCRRRRQRIEGAGGSFNGTIGEEVQYVDHVGGVPQCYLQHGLSSVVDIEWVVVVQKVVDDGGCRFRGCGCGRNCGEWKQVFELLIE